jgi:hypothetical protein
MPCRRASLRDRQLHVSCTSRRVRTGDQGEVRGSGERKTSDSTWNVLGNLHGYEVIAGAVCGDVASVGPGTVLIDLVQRHCDGAICTGRWKARGRGG